MAEIVKSVLTWQDKSTYGKNKGRYGQIRIQIWVNIK